MSAELFRLDGKVALLAGGSRGLGLAMGRAGSGKGGAVQPTKAIAREWPEHGILVGAIGPGPLHIELTDELYSDPARREATVARIPLARPGVPSDLAGASVFLGSPASGYVTGQLLWVEGGRLVA